ncbi:MAG: MBL fold metallo-hydrolase [Acidobacteria bacterium]|nr:MBL fold metallo-hydrolase [Acidobacteriota bacterium]
MNYGLILNYGLCAVLVSLLVVGTAAAQQKNFAEDVFQAEGGDVRIAFIGHGTLMITYAGKVIHVDPVSMYADYATMPKADLILVTHEHGDHLDSKAIQAVTTSRTTLITNQASAKNLSNASVMKNGETRTVDGITIEAVPAYNPEKQFHPKGNGNGYVLTLGGKRVFVAGDTEDVPEIKELKNIDIAFLPMNLPFTMTPEQVADTAKAMRPKIIYPYHFGETDTNALVRLMSGEKDIEVRIRDLK